MSMSNIIVNRIKSRIFSKLKVIMGTNERCKKCSIKCNLIKVSPEVLKELETGFKKLLASDSNSLLKKHLTQDVYNQLKERKTSYGSTLLDCIQSGLQNLDSGVGIYAPDPEAYSIFALIFDPIIQDYHMGFSKVDRHPKLDWGDLNNFENLDPTGEFVISTRVRCGRSIDGYPFNPCMTQEQYKEIEDKMREIFNKEFNEDLAGEYKPLRDMPKDVQQKLIDEHFLFKEGDRFLQAAKASRFWPIGRGIFLNNTKTFLVWVNEEDHLRIISMQMGGDLAAVYKRMVKGVQILEKHLNFARNPRFGFLTFCPSNLGTTVRASVHIKLPNLASDKAQLESIAEKFSLQVRGTRGEHSDSEEGIYDISNKRRLGLTEAQAVREMQEGIQEMIRLEMTMKE